MIRSLQELRGQVRALRGAIAKSFTKQLALFVVVFVLLTGVISGQALKAFISFEAEGGTLAGQAARGNDANAAGGSFLTFNTPPTSSTGRCQHTATRICYNGEYWYINGINMPWNNWPYINSTSFGGDFGMGNGGVAANRTGISNRLAQFSDTDSTVVRWWIFQGGALQINRDANGRPTSINESIYTDIDAALQIAEQQDFYYNFTLFGGMQDGHMPRAWRTNTSYRQDLANVLAPLFARYKDNPRVMAWEIWNEPEWDYRNNVDGATREQATDMASRIIAVIRQQAPKTMTTVGQSLVSDLGDWRNVDLDFDSPHWYDIHPETPHNALLNTATGLQTTHGTNGRPIVIGEYPHTGSNAQQNVDRMNQLYDRGYAGAWAWSLFYDHTDDRMQVDLGALRTFTQQHNDIGPK